MALYVYKRSHSPEIQQWLLPLRFKSSSRLRSSIRFDNIRSFSASSLIASNSDKSQLYHSLRIVELMQELGDGRHAGEPAGQPHDRRKYLLQRCANIRRCGCGIRADAVLPNAGASNYWKSVSTVSSVRQTIREGGNWRNGVAELSACWAKGAATSPQSATKLTTSRTIAVRIEEADHHGRLRTGERQFIAISYEHDPVPALARAGAHAAGVRRAITGARRIDPGAPLANRPSWPHAGRNPTAIAACP
jgi:hypothetical protein